jgi:hypothetical protein
MPNTHLEHPEDLILTGDLSAIDALYSDAHISVKIDGAPAIVWGTHPETKQFFVCTKAAFNKKKIRICYNEDDVFTYFGHQHSVAQILIACLDYLPRTEGVFQGDWIGFATGLDTFKPNTITYKFSEPLKENIVIAPHTYYTGKYLPEMEAHPITGEMISTSKCKFVQPFVDKIATNITAPKIQMDSSIFLTKKEAMIAKQNINALIRNGQGISDADLIGILGSLQLANLYLMVIEMKHELMESFIVYNCPKSYIDGEQVNQEGFVMTTKYGMMKLVNREQFSYANFVNGKFQK